MAQRARAGEVRDWGRLLRWSVCLASVAGRAGALRLILPRL